MSRRVKCRERQVPQPRINQFDIAIHPQRPRLQEQLGSRSNHHSRSNRYNNRSHLGGIRGQNPYYNNRYSSIIRFQLIQVLMLEGFHRQVTAPLRQGHTDNCSLSSQGNWVDKLLRFFSSRKYSSLNAVVLRILQPQ